MKENANVSVDNAASMYLSSGTYPGVTTPTVLQHNLWLIHIHIYCYRNKQMYRCGYIWGGWQTLNPQFLLLVHWVSVPIQANDRSNKPARIKLHLEKQCSSCYIWHFSCNYKHRWSIYSGSGFLRRLFGWLYYHSGRIHIAAGIVKWPRLMRWWCGYIEQVTSL